MKILNQTIFAYDELIRFYKRVFAIFYWQCYLPTSIDLKISKLSRALNRHILLFSLINFLLYMWCLHIHYCETLQNTNRTEIFNMYPALYAFPVSIAVFVALMSFDNFKKMGFELMCLDSLILKRLNHKNDYRKFRRSVVMKIGLCLSILLCCGIQKLNSDNKLLPFNEMTAALKCIRIYVELHAMFVISLYQYMYKMFCKYINFAYHVHRSHVVFLYAKSIEMNLRYYKEIHYKFWCISCELNHIFGIIIMTFCCQTSMEFIASVCHVFSNWDEYYGRKHLRILSNDTVFGS